MAEAPKYDPSKGLSAIDKILLAGAASHKSGAEISALTNGVVKPAEAMLRIQNLLDERDWLSESHKQLLLIDDMMDLKDRLKKELHEWGNIKAAGPLLKTLVAISDTLSREKSDITTLLKEIRTAHAHMMLEGVKLALERTNSELERRHPDIAWKGELNEIFVMAMPEAVKEIEGRVVEA